MTKLRFNRKSLSFVSLLSSFVLVVIASFALLSHSLSTASLVQAQQAGQNTTRQPGEVGAANDARASGAVGAGVGAAASRDRVGTLVNHQNNVDEGEETGKPNLDQFTSLSVGATANTFTCNLTPCDPSGAFGVTDSSLTGNMTRMIGYMYTEQPASTYIAVADFMNSAGIEVAPPAYAQSAVGGLGFASLTPILNAWKTFRNIAFLFFVIIILVIGFMIMFRQKVGQSAVTAQQAIPRVVIALITVSFSYAIAGLLIDAMYITMTLMIYVFGLGNKEGFLLGSNAVELGIHLVTTGAAQSFEAIQALVNGIAPINLGAEFLAGWTVGLVVAIAIVFAMFRLFFELLKTYVTIILSITLAPLLLMFGAIPGRDVFGKWVRGLIGNLAAFPIVLLILIIYDQLTGGISDNNLLTNANSGPTSEYVSIVDHFDDANIVSTAQAQSGFQGGIQEGGFSPPYLFGLVEPGGIAQFFIGMGLLLIMTDLVKQGKKALGADEGAFGQFATAFGDSLKKGWTGGELIPGLGFTDTRKLPFGGVSGQNVTRKGATIFAGAGSGTVGAATGAVNRGLTSGWARRYQGPIGMGRGFVTGATEGIARGSNRGFLRGAQYASDKLGDEQLFAKNREARKKGTKKYGDT